METLDRFVKRRKLEFPLLSDPGSDTIKAWKLLNEAAKGKGEGIPHPMTYVIDKTGVIRAKLGREGYQTRHTIEEMLNAAKQLSKK